MDHFIISSVCGPSAAALIAAVLHLIRGVSPYVTVKTAVDWRKVATPVISLDGTSYTWLDKAGPHQPGLALNDQLNQD